MCKSKDKGDVAKLSQPRQTKNVDFALVFCVKVEKKVIWHYVLRRDLRGPKHSGITLAVVWRTQVHGTQRRRAIKRGLHTFPNDFWSFFGRQGAEKSYNNKRHIWEGNGFSFAFI